MDEAFLSMGREFVLLGNALEHLSSCKQYTFIQHSYVRFVHLGLTNLEING